jgi:hypothetical protein
MFGPKRGAGTEEWRKLRNYSFMIFTCNKLSFGDQMKEDEMERLVARRREKKLHTGIL